MEGLDILLSVGGFFLLVFLVILAFKREDKDFFSDITGDVENAINWHDNIGRNNVAVQRANVANKDGKTNWWNNSMPKGAGYGPTNVEFKEDPMMSGVAQQAMISSDPVIYGDWQDPMEIFPLNEGPFKTKRLVRNKDFNAVLLGVPGATPEQINKRLDSIYMPNKNNITAEDRTKILVDTPYPSEGGGPYSRNEYYTRSFASVPAPQAVIRASQTPVTVVQNGTP